MNKLDNYIYHKIALATYDLYQKYDRNSKSKGIISVGLGFNGFCQSISIIIKKRSKVAIPDKNDEKFITDIMSITMGYVNDVYGINDSSVGVKVFDFFHDDIWMNWASVICNTKKYFGV